MLAQKPPLGWNSWNTFGGKIDADLVKETADAFVETGLRDAGYEYIVIDDVWEDDERRNNRLTWDKEKFPEGIPALAEYIHSKSLKFGIYSCAGSHTCAGKPGSFGYEEEDAQTFAEWGVDFLKYDYCYIPPGTDGPMLYRRMGQSLRSTRRPIVFSLCEWGTNKPWEWGASVGGHMWRTTGDINDSWESILDIGFNRQEGLESYAGPGHWNDPDMLVVGMYGKGNVGRGNGCTDAEYRSHFALWCLLASPLMLGCDIRNMNPATSSLLMNPNLLAVNQDSLGRQAYRVGTKSDVDQTVKIYAKILNDGSIAVGLFNLSQTDHRTITVSWESLGLHDRRPCQAINLWNGEVLGVYQRAFSVRVDTHDASVVRLVPQVK